MNEPVSAPPVPGITDPGGLEAASQRLDDRAEIPTFSTEEVFPEYAAARVIAMREIMTISNRYDYNHYYSMPAFVGMANMQQLVNVMISEGCKLSDIQVTFEIKERK